MTASSAAVRRVAVIGGGISGLAAAHRLRELDPAVEVTLFERSERLGGVLRTTRAQGYLIEHGADSFITNLPWGVDLCRRLGIDGQLLGTNPLGRRALVLHRGRTYPVPEAFVLMQPKKVWPIITTPLLSWRAKLRLLGEWFVPAKQTSEDESLQSFVTRRLGREAFERLVQPLVAGIYTADAAKLSLAATMPQFLEMERKQGGLLRATFRQAWRGSSQTKKTEDNAAHGARYGLFVTPREGLASLIDALAARLPAGCVQLNTSVESVAPTSDRRWQVAIAGLPAETFDAVVIALPAPVAARLTSGFDAELAQSLGSIEYAGAIVALVGCRRDQLTHPLYGFGFVIPEVERRQILSVSFSSQKFADRAPAEHVLLRVFLGGGMHPEILELADDEVRQIVERELRELLGWSGQHDLFQIQRWTGVMPQYHLGHLDRVAQIEQRTSAWPGLALAGNAYRGVGIPQCIRSGEQAAERILKSSARSAVP